jgi:hypothetical protein
MGSDIIHHNSLSIPIGDHTDKIILVGGSPGLEEYCRLMSTHIEGLEHDFFLVNNICESCGTKATPTGFFENLVESLHGEALNHYSGGQTAAVALSLLPISKLAERIPPHKRYGVAPAECASPEQAMSSRKKRNTNLLVIPATYVPHDIAQDIVKSWIETPFDHVTHGNGYITLMGEHKKCTDERMRYRRY